MSSRSNRSNRSNPSNPNQYLHFFSSGSILSAEFRQAHSCFVSWSKSSAWYSPTDSNCKVRNGKGQSAHPSMVRQTASVGHAYHPPHCRRHLERPGHGSSRPVLASVISCGRMGKAQSSGSESGFILFAAFDHIYWTGWSACCCTRVRRGVFSCHDHALYWEWKRSKKLRLAFWFILWFSLWGAAGCRGTCVVELSLSVTFLIWFCCVMVVISQISWLWHASFYVGSVCTVLKCSSWMDLQIAL